MSTDLLARLETAWARIDALEADKAALVAALEEIASAPEYPPTMRWWHTARQALARIRAGEVQPEGKCSQKGA